jgi:3-oxoacyl-[acyl-carrier protein] reductase
MAEFDNKVAMVTGASKGIGKGIAIELARNGADVVVNYCSDKEGANDSKDQIENLGRKAIIVEADVGKFKDVKNMFDITYKEFGKVDILVNNSAVAIWKPFDNFTEEDWDRTININLKSIFMTTQLALPSMKKNGGGVIVNIGSVAGHAYLDCLVPYGASKGGVNLISMGLAVELAKYNIRVNVVSPGTIAIKRNFETDPNYPDNWFPFIPQGRVGEVSEVVDPVIFMCSSKASHITGQILYVDGGVTSYIPMPSSDFAKKTI